MRVSLVLINFVTQILNFIVPILTPNWGMRTVAFTGVGITLMADIPIYGMMEKLQCYQPERSDEIVEMLSIYLNWRMNQLSYSQRRQMCADY